MSGSVGGEIIPIWGAERPDWLTDKLLRPLSAGSNGAQSRVLGPGALADRMQHRLPERNPVAGRRLSRAFGPVCDSLLSGEGGVNLLIARAGYRLYYDPSILVRHHIPAARLTRTWFRRRVFWQGVTLNLLHRYVDATARRLGFSEPAGQARAWEEIVVPISATAWSELFDDPGPDDFGDQLDRIEALGYLLESQSVVVGSAWAAGRDPAITSIGDGG